MEMRYEVWAEDWTAPAGQRREIHLGTFGKSYDAEFFMYAYAKHYETRAYVKDVYVLKEGLRTERGQAARICRISGVEVAIELYANGEWRLPAGCFKNTFTCFNDALNYFLDHVQSLHS